MKLHKKLSTPTQHDLDRGLSAVILALGFRNQQHRPRLVQLDPQRRPRICPGLEVKFGQQRAGVFFCEDEQPSGIGQLAFDGERDDGPVLSQLRHIQMNSVTGLPRLTVEGLGDHLVKIGAGL
jgi:hypothetical protein